MENKTFKESSQETKVIKEVKKSGLSLAIIFSKEDLQRFNLCYGDKIELDEARIIKQDSNN